MNELIQRGFGSDNHSGVHPDILHAIIQANNGHAPSYGTDAISERVDHLFKKHFSQAAKSFYVFNGSAANVLSLVAMVESIHSVLCTDCSHLNVDECAAPENYIGCKLIPVPSQGGKLNPKDLEKYIIRRGDQHFSQVRALSITQPTELGTVYSVAEIRDLVRFARAHKLYVHMDGARLVNAAASLGVSLANMTTDVGIDVLSFGGTKNGLLFGEAVIVFNETLAQNFKFYRKQAMQLPSKTRFVAAQFEAFLSNDLWLKNAQHANSMAQYLAQRLKPFKSIEITQETQSNAVFAKIPKPMIAALREVCFFYVWDEATFECRLMTSFDSTKEDIDRFIAKIEEIERS